MLAALTRSLARAPPAGVRALCAGRTWDPHAMVHGRKGDSKAVLDEASAADEIDAVASGRRAGRASREERAGDARGGRFGSGFGGRGGRADAKTDVRDVGRLDMMQFQAFVRQRLAQMAPRMPSVLDVRGEAEMAYLEEQVVEDHMPARRRKLRDPLKDVPLSAITHTNLPLLCRFVSDGGAILPRKLTGVQAKKQRALAKAIKRAQQLALMPVIWKHPKYRHASFSDAYTRPERPLPQRYEGDEFADPPDPRYPGVWDVHPLRAVDIGAMIRGNASTSPITGDSDASDAAPSSRR